MKKKADKAAKPAAKKKKKKNVEKSAYEGDSSAHCSDKVFKVAKSYAELDLKDVNMRVARNRVYSAGYHAELKRRRHQKCEDEKAKTEARAFGRQCRDLWLTMIKK